MCIRDSTASDLEETQKSIEKEKMRVAGIRGEIRSYFERYRQDARAKAVSYTHLDVYKRQS